MEQGLKSITDKKSDWKRSKRIFYLVLFTFLMNLSFFSYSVCVTLQPEKFSFILELEEFQQSATLLMQKAWKKCVCNTGFLRYSMWLNLHMFPWWMYVKIEHFNKVDIFIIQLCGKALIFLLTQGFMFIAWAQRSFKYQLHVPTSSSVHSLLIPPWHSCSITLVQLVEPLHQTGELQLSNQFRSL